ncbi:hypothetical protein L9F63_006363 [Diploptera punctata]|uniref:Uncharacterized protein n=1 Tax=Diploptera punctata TaxID=6984 RepID=A0AAD7ZAR7_DIPPU|nr:hypothetical protein L9F63_006363 [Diploptera punctata]
MATDENEGEEIVGDSIISGLKVVYRTYEQCENVKLGDLVTCLKLRALKFADRMLRSSSIPLVDGISIVKSYPGSEDRNGRKIKFEPLTEINEESLPTDLDERQAKLDELLVERFSRFFKTHSIHFEMPKFVDEIKEIVAGGDDSDNDVMEGE